MSAMKHATLALALLAGTALGAQAQSTSSPSYGTSPTAGARSASTATGSAPSSPRRAGHDDGSLARTGGAGSSMGTTGRGNPMPNNSDLGTGPAGPSVAGRSTGPGTGSTQTR